MFLAFKFHERITVILNDNPTFARAFTFKWNNCNLDHHAVDNDTLPRVTSCAGSRHRLHLCEFVRSQFKSFFPGQSFNERVFPGSLLSNNGTVKQANTCI